MVDNCWKLSYPEAATFYLQRPIDGKKLATKQIRAELFLKQAGSAKRKFWFLFLPVSIEFSF